MTDATMGGGGRGGVGIRLFVEGGELVKRTFGQIGDSGKKMWAEIALGQKASNPALRAMSSLAGEAKERISGLAAESGAAGRALGAFGVVGVSVAAVLGALVIAARAAFVAMNDAAELTDQADRLGINAKLLQKWGFAADEAGVKAGALGAGMEKLTGFLGAFKLGIGDAKLKPVFEELGLTPEALANVETGDQLLMMLADTLGQVQDRSQQVKLARALGIEDLLPLLRLGSDGIRDLGEEAERLGVIMDDDVRAKLDAADRQMEISGQQMKILRDVAVSPLAEAFADASTWAANFTVSMSRIEGNSSGWVRALRYIASAMPGGGGVFSRTAWGAAGNDQPISIPMDEDDPALLRQRMAVNASNGNGRGYEPRGHTSGGGGSRGGGADTAARDAERLRQEQDRAREQLRRAETQNDRDILPLRYGMDTALDHENTALETQRLYVEERAAQRAALKASLEKAKLLDEDVQARLDALAVMDAEHDELVETRIAQTRTRELAEERLKRETVVAEDAIALLDIEGQLATTDRERYDIGRKILLAEQELERKILDAAMRADGIVGDDEQQHYDQVLRRQRGDVVVFDAAEEDRMRNQFRDMGREVVGAIEDGRIGEMIADRLKSRLMDMAVDGLFDFMKGGGQSEGGGFLNTAFKAVSSLFSKGGGRASGGGVESGYRYGMTEHGPELALFGTRGQVMNHAETAQMVRDLAGVDGGAGSGSAGTTIIQQDFHYDLKGAVVTEDLMRSMDQKADAARASAVREAGQAAPIHAIDFMQKRQMLPY